ncbi:MAG TPA: hypothetical protein VFQ68_14590 [Streptosporangiaceae bacterium]|nr:hypothetical protein [Streptosporangiaceae bacterium]
MTPAHPAPALAPAEREYQREYGADDAAYRDDQCRGMVVGGGSRRDQHHSLTQADATLGQAEGLASLSGRRRADETGIGFQLVTGAQAGDEQDEQRQQQARPPGEQHEDSAARERERAHVAGPGRRGDETAEREHPGRNPQRLRRQYDPHRERACAQVAGERGDDALGRAVERRQPAEQHGGAQDPVREDQAGPGEDAGQPGGSLAPVGRRRGGGARPDPGLDDEPGYGEGSRVDDERGPGAEEAGHRAAQGEPDDLRELDGGKPDRGADHVTLAG